MKTPPFEPAQAAAAGTSSSTSSDSTASPRPRGDGMARWTRLVAWLGLGCIGAANPARSSQHCALGCVSKQADRKRRKRTAVINRPRPRRMPATAAPGVLVHKSKQVLERILVWVSP
jgi:hypothetical protein